MFLPSNTSGHQQRQPVQDFENCGNVVRRERFAHPSAVNGLFLERVSMIKSKIKSIGLGIACMAFSLSGVAHASQISVDNGKCGKHSNVCSDVKDIVADLKDLGSDYKDLCSDKKDLSSDKKDLCKDEKEIHCDFNSDSKNFCSLIKDICSDKKDIHCDEKDICSDEKDICSDTQDIRCDLKDLEKDTCNKDVKCDIKDVLCDLSKLQDEHGCKAKSTWEDITCDMHDIVCDVHHDGCDPHSCSVPAPASAEMSGLGLLGIALMGWAKSRRAARA